MWHNIKKGLRKELILNIEPLQLGLFLLTLFGLALITACGGGGGDDGTTPESQTSEVTGVVSKGTAKNISPETYKTKALALNLCELIAPKSAFATGQAGTFIVRAVGRDGSIHETDTDPGSGMFTLHLPVDECYTMSFTAHTGPGMMDVFWDNMVFECGPEHMGEFDDQFCLSPGDDPVDLGVISVYSDHRFAMPMNNPLEVVDSNGDGIMDFVDQDYVCGNVEDMNHDGYYDDDFNHDGFHDDDMNFDGFHDDDMDHDGFHDDMRPGGDMGHR